MGRVGGGGGRVRGSEGTSRAADEGEPSGDMCDGDNARQVSRGREVSKGVGSKQSPYVCTHTRGTSNIPLKRRNVLVSVATRPTSASACETYWVKKGICLLRSLMN